MLGGISNPFPSNGTVLSSQGHPLTSNLTVLLSYWEVPFIAVTVFSGEAACVTCRFVLSLSCVVYIQLGSLCRLSLESTQSCPLALSTQTSQ